MWWCRLSRKPYRPVEQWDLFAFFSEIEKRDIVVGERVLLTLWVEGTGNLNFLQFPSIENPGFSLVEEDERNNFVATAEGYRGIREYRYTLLAEEAGNKAIRINSFSAIQPLTERVYTLPGASYRMGITDPGVMGDEDSEAEEFPFELEDPSELQQVNLSRRF